MDQIKDMIKEKIISNALPLVANRIREVLSYELIHVIIKEIGTKQLKTSEAYIALDLFY